jgi:hypothetical protein
LTFAELISHIETQHERVLADLSGEIVTDKSHYVRVSGVWVRDEAPGAASPIYTRGGTKYVWKQAEVVK